MQLTLDRSKKLQPGTRLLYNSNGYVDSLHGKMIVEFIATSYDHVLIRILDQNQLKTYSMNCTHVSKQTLSVRYGSINNIKSIIEEKDNLFILSYDKFDEIPEPPRIDF